MNRQTALVVGYGDLGKAVEKELFSAGYETLHAHHDSYKSIIEVRQPHIIANCCGVFEFSSIFEDLNLGVEKWDRVFDANVRFAWELALNYYKYCKSKEGWQYLVNIGSESAFVPHRDSILYCASKSALGMITKCLSEALELHKFCILQVNPGMMKDTKMTTMILERYPQSDEDFVTKEKVAKFIVYLLSLGPVTNGQSYNIGVRE